MKPTHFAALLVVAVISAVSTIIAYAVNRPWTADNGGRAELMLPGLKASADKIAGIEINQGGKIVKIQQKDSKWVIATESDYPANFVAVRRVLLDASEASLIERKTAKEDMLPLLELGDPKVPGASSRLIRFLDEKGNAIAEFVAGKSKSDAFGPGKPGTYVRHAGDQQSWLADRDIGASANLGDWAKTRVVDQTTDAIKTMVVEVPSEAAYTIDRGGDGRTHKLAQMPAGKKLKYVNSVDEIVESASYVDFKSVRKVAGAPSLPDVGKVTFETDGGLKVAETLKSDGKQAFMTIAASGTGDAKKDAEALSAQVDGWEFEIPVAKVSSLMKKQADLLEDARS